MIRQMLKDSAIYGIAATVSRFVGVLLIPIYTRVFTPEQYGLLDLLITTSFILVLLSGLQIESGVARSYYEAKKIGYERTLLGTGVMLLLASNMVWALLIALFFCVSLNGDQSITWIHVVPLLLALLPTQLLTLWQLVLRLQARALMFVFLSVSDLITTVLLTILTLVLLGWGIAGVMWSLFLSKLIWSVVGAKLLNHSYHLNFDIRYAKDILIYGVPLVPAALTKWGQNYVNRYLIAVLLTFTQVGLFSIAVKIASAVALLDTAFRLAWDPYAWELMEQPGAEKQYARMANFYLVGMFGACAVVSALGSAAIKVLTTDAYLGAGHLVGFIAMGLLWNGSLQIFGLGTAIVRQTYWSVVGFGIAGVLNIALLLVTATRWGLLAAAVSYLLGTIIAVLVILGIAQYLHYIPYKYSSIAITLFASLLLPFLFYFLPNQVTTSILYESLAKLSIALLVWVIIFVLVIPHDEKKALFAQVRVLQESWI